MTISILPCKTNSFIYLALLGVCTTALAQTPPTQENGAEPPPLPIPAEVRALMTVGAFSLSVVDLPIKDGQPPLLLHAWAEKNRTPPPTRYEEMGEPAKRRFHVDFFYLENAKWQLSLPVSYMGQEPQYPIQQIDRKSYKPRWLDPGRKRGLVIIEEIHLGDGTSRRLITLPRGVPLNRSANTDAYQVHDFGTFGGGGDPGSIHFGVEASGQMIVEEDWPQMYERTKTVYGWREGQWQRVLEYSYPYAPPNNR